MEDLLGDVPAGAATRSESPIKHSHSKGATSLECLKLSSSETPLPGEKEIEWILDEVRNYLNTDVTVKRSDVLSAWSGLRPLVKDPSAHDTQSLVRNHMIHVSDSGLLTISGGKWTTYREMAEQTVDRAVEAFNLKPIRDCVTLQVRLIGLMSKSTGPWRCDLV